MIKIVMTFLESGLVIFATAVMYFMIWCSVDIFRVMLIDWKRYPTVLFKITRASMWFLSFAVSFAAMRVNGAFITHFFF